jgi:hypothetical protein
MREWRAQCTVALSFQIADPLTLKGHCMLLGRALGRSDKWTRPSLRGVSTHRRLFPSRFCAQQQLLFVLAPACHAPCIVRLCVCVCACSLSREILDYVEYVKCLTAAALPEMNHMIDLLREEVASIWPSATLEIFGSLSTGFFLPSSDIDLVLRVRHPCFVFPLLAVSSLSPSPLPATVREAGFHSRTDALFVGTTPPAAVIH